VTPPSHASHQTIEPFERRRAISLRDAIAGADGVALADEWLHPEDIVALGIEAAG
jgi:hypothetical protein